MEFVPKIGVPQLIQNLTIVLKQPWWLGDPPWLKWPPKLGDSHYGIVFPHLANDHVELGLDVFLRGHFRPAHRKAAGPLSFTDLKCLKHFQACHNFSKTHIFIFKFQFYIRKTTQFLSQTGGVFCSSIPDVSARRHKDEFLRHRLRWILQIEDADAFQQPRQWGGLRGCAPKSGGLTPNGTYGQKPMEDHGFPTWTFEWGKCWEHIGQWVAEASEKSQLNSTDLVSSDPKVHCDHPIFGMRAFENIRTSAEQRHLRI